MIFSPPTVGGLRNSFREFVAERGRREAARAARDPYPDPSLFKGGRKFGTDRGSEPSVRIATTIARPSRASYRRADRLSSAPSDKRRRRAHACWSGRARQNGRRD